MEKDLKSLITKNIKDIVKKEYDMVLEKVHLEHPDNEKWGDYAANVALVMAKQLNQSPLAIAKKIAYRLSSLNLEFEKQGNKYPIFENIETASPGFINFKISSEWLQNVLYFIQDVGKDYGRGKWVEKKKVLVEYTDPNPFKVFHIGHLMSNCIGESLSRLLEFGGSELKRANYQGDVGMHVAKSIWGMKRLLTGQKMTLNDISGKNLSARVSFLGQCYVLGAAAFDEDPKAVEEMKDINYLVFISAQEFLKSSEGWEPRIDYRKHLSKVENWDLEEVRNLYEAGRAWSLELFETIYERLGTKFDFYYFESLVGEYGYSIVKEFLEKGVFEENEGAIIFRGEEYGLHTRVFINSLDLPTYEAKDLGLAFKKHQDFAYDISVIVTANEIAEYFKVVLKALSLTHPELAEKTRHIYHGMMKLESGKMSSRTGDVITGDSLIDEVKRAVKEKMDVSRFDEDADVVADQIAVGAVKYDILKQGIGKNIIFKKERSLSLTGNTGPYLQYTHARANSVLEKGAFEYDPDLFTVAVEVLQEALTEKESALLRWIYRFPEIIDRAALELSPNLVCEYLFQLAQKYNNFYNDVPILNAETVIMREFRLLLTKCVKDILKTGLYLLGIKAPAKI